MTHQGCSIPQAELELVEGYACDSTKGEPESTGLSKVYYNSQLFWFRLN